MRVLALTLVALLGAAASATAQGAPAGAAPGAAPSRPAPSSRQLPLPPSATCPCRCRQRRPRRGPGRSSTRSCSASRSRAARRSSRPTPTSTTSSCSGQHLVPGRLGAVQRGDRADRSWRTSSGCGRRTSWTTFRSRSIDYRFANGVIGKIVVYNMEERQRVKIVDYEGNQKVDQNKIEEELKEEGVTIRARLVHRPGPASPGRRRRARAATPRRATSSPRSSPRSRQSTADRSWCTSPSTSPKGRRSRSATSTSSATQAISDGKLAEADEGEQGRRASSASSPAAGPTRKTSSRKTREAVQEHYRDEGYIMAQVGQPELKVARRLRGRQDALGRSCGSRSPKASATASASSTSKATRSSSARRLRRSSRSKRASLQPQEDHARLREGA